MHIETMGRPPGCKLIRITADIEGGIIRALSIRGDFFASPEAGFDRAERRLPGLPLEEAGRAFDSFLAEEGVEAFGINGEAFSRLLREAAESGEAGEASPAAARPAADTGGRDG
jgi:hypothetical protein